MRKISPSLSSFYHSQPLKNMAKKIYIIHFESIKTQNFSYCLVLPITSAFTTGKEECYFVYMMQGDYPLSLPRGLLLGKIIMASKPPPTR